MNDWSEGYMIDTEYVYLYQTQLNPLRQRLSLLHHGILPPHCATACELGFGQGLSVNIHAAASDCEWWGNDFNPAHANYALSLATVAGNRARLFEQSFEEFCGRTDLPEFDFIGLHGIWSWVSDQNRALIVDFIRRRLRPGGVVYMCYNTLPGWAPVDPVRRLIHGHVNRMTPTGMATVDRLAAALAFVDRLLSLQPIFVTNNPQLATCIQDMKKKDLRYLSHEYLNQEWKPMLFSEIADWLRQAKLEYAGPANFKYNLPLMLNNNQKAFLDGIPDANYRETVFDFFCDRSYREDYWVKGIRRLPEKEQRALQRRERVVMLTPLPDPPPKIQIGQKMVDIDPAIYHPLMEIVADNCVRSLGEIEDMLQSRGIAFSKLLEVVLHLTAKGLLQPAQDEDALTKAQSSSDKLNGELLKSILQGRKNPYLASPVTGGGVTVHPLMQLFLLAASQEGSTPEDWAKFVWQIYAERGEKLVHNGKPIMSDEDNFNHMKQLSSAFAKEYYPILQSLRISVAMPELKAW